MKKLYILGAIVCGFAACKPNIEPKAPERGDADFSRYMAVGSSHTAGIMNRSLYREGQENSYPSMLAEQFRTVGGGEFKQPWIPGEHGWPLGKLMQDMAQGPCDTLPYKAIVPFRGALDTAGAHLNIYSQGPFGNMAIPETKVGDYIVDGFANNNRFARRMFNKPATARPVDELLLPEHTFFTMWLGVEDVLNYAAAGGETAPSANNRNRITSPAAFRVAYDSVLNTVIRNGAKGTVLTIPDVLDMPYFRALPAKSMELNLRDANRLNLKYNNSQVHFDVGMNYYLIEDNSAPKGYRQLREGELIRMDVPHDSITCAGWGWEVPMPAVWVLTLDEIQNINNTISSYNGIIYSLGQKYNIPVTDINYYLGEVLNNGAQYNGGKYSYEFIQGGIFSLDGLRFTGRGNALIANAIINTINDKYGSSIPYVDVNQYSGIKQP